jgi:permuted papain-like amidase YaeF/Yiix C92 family enzyme
MATSQSFVVSIAMIPKRAGRILKRSVARLLDRLRTSATSAVAFCLARPLDEFSTLTTADRQALAAVLRPGDVLLSAGNTRFAELVKRLTQSTWSHVSMYVGPMEESPDPLCVVEAELVHGVRAIRLSQLCAQRVCVLRPVGVDDKERARLAEFVLGRIGSEYDLAHAWLLARVLLLRRWWAGLRSIPATMRRSATRFICSSLIAHAFALIGYSILPAGVTMVDGTGNHNALVPADFERASLFAVVWPVNARDERG